MPNTLSDADNAKRAAAARALEMVENGMKVGLGTGSTAAWFVRLLSERIHREGLAIVGVATSSTTVFLAQDLGVPLTSLDEAGTLDLTVDGTDEFDAGLNLIKGGGAALLREKIVAAASERMIVIADDSKRVSELGAFPLPVEVIRFGVEFTRTAILKVLSRMDVANAHVELRKVRDGALVTDEGHHILDLHLGRIGNPSLLSAALNALPGVVETGLFIGMADMIIVGKSEGWCEIHHRDAPMDTSELMRNEDA